MLEYGIAMQQQLRRPTGPDGVKPLPLSGHADRVGCRNRGHVWGSIRSDSRGNWNVLRGRDLGEDDEKLSELRKRDEDRFARLHPCGKSPKVSLTGV